MKNYKTIIGAAAAGLALTAVSSQAQLNLTGGTVAGSLVGQTLAGVSPGGNVGLFNGTVSSWVISGAAADPTGLIFIYQVSNSGPDPIDNAEFTGFPGSDVLTGVGQTGSYATVSGLALTGSAAPSASGNFATYAVFGGTVTFTDGGSGLLNGGANSDFLAVLTTDQFFADSYGQIQDNFSASGPTLAPVPEANTVVAGALMLLPLGIGAVRALRKERTA